MENVELLNSPDGALESYSDGFSDEDEIWQPSAVVTCSKLSLPVSIFIVSLCWYQESLCPVEIIYFSDKKSITDEI